MNHRDNLMQMHTYQIDCGGGTSRPDGCHQRYHNTWKKGEGFNYYWPNTGKSNIGWNGDSLATCWKSVRSPPRCPRKESDEISDLLHWGFNWGLCWKGNTLPEIAPWQIYAPERTTVKWKFDGHCVARFEDSRSIIHPPSIHPYSFHHKSKNTELIMSPFFNSLDHKWCNIQQNPLHLALFVLTTSAVCLLDERY